MVDRTWPAFPLGQMCRENAMHVHAPEFRTMFSIPVRVMETNVAMPDMPPGQLCKVMD